MTAYTNTEAYEAYRTASQAILDAKETIKSLRKEQEQAANKARNETIGSVMDKITAALAAREEFNIKIALLEFSIEDNYKIADDNFDAWKGLK